MLGSRQPLPRGVLLDLGHDYAHVFVPEERSGPARRSNRDASARRPDPVNPVALLDRLSQVEAFERFLHRVFQAKTRFSIEGLDMTVLILDEIIGDAAEAGVGAMSIGMAHRGRLNIMAHVLNKPHAQILAEFKDPPQSRQFPGRHVVDGRREVSRRCASRD